MAQKDQTTGYGPVAVVGISIGVYLAAQVAASVVLVMVASIFGFGDEQTDSWLDGTTAQFGFSVLTGMITLGLLAWFMLKRRMSWSKLGLVRPRKRDAGYGLLGFGAYFVAAIVVMMILPLVWPGLDVDQEQNIGFALTTTGPTLVLVFISLVIMPAFVEEVQIRGFLYTGLRARLPWVSAAVITSSLFGLAHLQFSDGQSPLWVAVVDTFVLSMILVYLRERTGSLWSAITVHFMKNAMAFAFLFVF